MWFWIILAILTLAWLFLASETKDSTRWPWFLLLAIVAGAFLEVAGTESILNVVKWAAVIFIGYHLVFALRDTFRQSLREEIEKAITARPERS